MQLELDGSLDKQGMICDFALVKKRVKAWFDNSIDHALVVPSQLEHLSTNIEGGYTQVGWKYPNGQTFSCRSPEQAIVFVDLPEVTPQTLATWCEEQLLALFPDEVQGLSLRFVPEKIDGAYYHYSHGLQQHDGNCQRIAHGHRSMIEIYIDDERDAALEAQWAETFRDIYIATDYHLENTTDHDYYHFAYTAAQGEFEIKLPKRVCYVMDTETTVELIAEHLAGEVKAQKPESHVRVVAYEGVAKGAIASREA